MNLPANPREDTILELANNDPEIFSVIHQAITTHGIDTKAYAAVFRYFCSDMRPSNERLVYMTGSKVWKRGTKPLTDVMVLQELFSVSRLIREYVLLSWENCVFSAWLPTRELQQAEKAMDTLESIDKLKEILEAAAEDMKAAANSRVPPPAAPAKPKEDGINWEAPDDDDDWGEAGDDEP